MTSRRDQTTSFIRDAVVRELVERGHSLLTMESVARRSYSSIGSVYSRFANRSALLDDVLQSVILPTVRDLADHGPGNLETVLTRMLGDPTVSSHLHALVEISLASRLDPVLHDGAVEGIRLLHESFSLDGDDQVLTDGITWQLTSVVLGYFIMTGSGCSIPPLGADLAALVDSMMTAIDQPTRAETARLSGLNVPLPPTPPTRERDQISHALADHAAETLAESGLGGAKLRDIARRSGVTTGAVYRRYESKHALVNDVLLRELNEDKYKWTMEFLESLARDPSAYSAAQVMTREVLTLMNDKLRLLAGIEITQAARVDENVRNTIATQVHNAARARARMFEDLVEAGIARDDISPQLVGWLIQIAPAGDRVLTMMGMDLDEQVLTRTMQAFVRTVI